MKRIAMSLAAFVLVGTFSIPVFSQEPKEKSKEKKETETITIIRKNVNTDEKTVIEIQGDKVTINGKPSTEIKDGSVSVRRNRLRSPSITYSGPGQGNWNFNLFSVDENQAMLGVVTEKSEKGVEITDITDESAAEKAGLKEGDIITKVNDTKIEDPDDLSDLIRNKKPGEKVTVTFLRDKKEQKVTAELGKWKGPFAYGVSPMPDMKILDDMRPHLGQIPRVTTPYGQGFSWSGGNQRLGLSVQDTEDGKGVKVIEVDEESNAAKAGVKEGDIITHVNDKEVNGADEVAKIVRESREKGSINLKLTRDKKNMNIDVKIPRRIRTAEL